jgi:anti-anti-sigma factor
MRRDDEATTGLVETRRYGVLVRRGPTPAAAGLDESSHETSRAPLLTGRSRADGTTPPSASPCLDIVIRRMADNVIVSMHGELTAKSGAGIGHLLRDLICDQGNLHVVIDVDEVTVVDTHGLAALIEAGRLARQCGSALTVRHPPEPIRKALDASGSHRDHFLAGLVP